MSRLASAAPRWNHLAIEVSEFFQQPHVLQQGRTTCFGGHFMKF